MDRGARVDIVLLFCGIRSGIFHRIRSPIGQSIPLALALQGKGNVSKGGETVSREKKGSSVDRLVGGFRQLDGRRTNLRIPLRNRASTERLELTPPQAALRCLFVSSCSISVYGRHDGPRRWKKLTAIERLGKSEVVWVLAPDERGKIASNSFSICEIEHPAYPQPLCSPARTLGIRAFALEITQVLQREGQLLVTFEM
jgi:hypothetical protein